ncbi:ABC transporter permease [Alkalicoccobacillus porphyridii]|uniref:FtsX-like permease family protein n=1 Tax=Alkalicoccobacillus porphyridii TaxID=2597270 RepID=A0A554A2X2_9BACI|nr:ABC transporter permease [Alkalicoccobacillus porphyridii]TSB47986.1 FtsX-like permease family protein [Alkalicoccobacillus porphyridii]
MLENIKLSFQSIFAHKMRSTLTMLGVIIGIAAIIAIVSMIQGQSEALKSNIIGMGNNTIQVTYEDMTMYGEGEEFWGGDSYLSAPPIQQETLDMITEDPLIDTVSLFHKSWSEAYHEMNMSWPETYAVDSTYFELFPIDILEGRMLTDEELDGKSQLVMINEATRDELFMGEEAIGQIIDMKGVPFRVVGVFAEKSNVEDPFFYDDWTPSIVYFSKGAWPIVEGYDAPTQILVRATASDSIQEAGEFTAAMLNSDLPTYETASYRIPDLQSIAEDLEAMNRTFALLLGGIASISLLVGGIGVMNIMLVSVTERTREIGIKKALGAKRHMILLQFLTEAVVLTSFGGALGVLVGIGAAKIISTFMSMPFFISISAVVGALLFSMMVGIIFGLLPSIKASKLQPVEALRYE